ncbi:hypothetical protein DQW77_14770 [Roseovarius sp. TE539]|uniref:tyrosine-type recombinase/integrase n=1 Tax=Roseovarius sp. TE539 TaxID=2249812 RepID=UPI000DDE5BBD|nr:tyrosine-type recombinase/integrase [Roseovarius sp. TE539]RBI70002.1 hypothetical protein DQW77_14770 [Roseovarius sp. TE539]
MRKPKQPRKIKGEPCWYPFWYGGSYCYDFYVEGQRYRQSTNVCDKASIKIAEGIAKAVHDAAWARALSDAPTLKDAAELYLAEFGVHETELEKIVGHYGPHIKIDEIDYLEIKRCGVELANSDVQPQTRRRQIKTPLLAVIRNAQGLRAEPQIDNVRERYLTPEEAERLIYVAKNPPSGVRDPDRRLLKMIALGLGSGVTPGEMFCIMASDVNRATGEIWISGEHVGAGKTKYRQRMVRLPDRAWQLIGDLPSEGRVFLSTTGREIIPDGKRGSTAIRQFRKLCDAAGLTPDKENPEPVVFYSLRHTWATAFASQVASEHALIQRGGWRDGRMAGRYRKRIPGDLADRLRAHGWNFKP